MTARIGVLEMDLVLPGINSLKGKRRIIASLKDRVRRRFNVSVAEVDLNDLHQRSILAVAAVCNDGNYLNSLLGKVLLFVQSEHRVSLVEQRIEVF